MTDHAPLLVIFAPRSRKSVRLDRWALRILENDYEIQYVKGKLNVADPLSRLLQQSEAEEDESDEKFIFLLAALNTSAAISMSELQEASESDEILQEIRKPFQTLSK